MEIKENKAITIYDIAKEAGVSASTVSRVLSNSANVRKEKKDRVLELIEKYHFEPNALAKGLSDTTSKTIGIIAADVRNPFYSSIYVSCEKAAREAGYKMLLCNSLGEMDLEISDLSMLKRQKVDAIIHIGGRVDDINTDPKFVAAVNCVTPTIPIVVTGKIDNADCYSVVIDANGASSLLTRHLIQLGHKRIALIGGRKNVTSTYQKYLTYCDILKENKIPFREEYIYNGGYDFETGYKGIKTLLGLKEIPTAVIAINDFSAAGVVRGIMEMGLKIPEDISVVSYDNTYISELLVPKLTSIDYDYENFGKKIVDVAIAGAEGRLVERHQRVSTKLVVRESSGVCKRP